MVIGFWWERLYTPSPCKLSIISHHQLIILHLYCTKILLSNPWQRVKKMTVACCNHVSSIVFSESGKKKRPFWPISNEVILVLKLHLKQSYPPGRPTRRRSKIYFAKIGLLHVLYKHIKFFKKVIYTVYNIREKHNIYVYRVVKNNGTTLNKS